MKQRHLDALYSLWRDSSDASDTRHGILTKAENEALRHVLAQHGRAVADEAARRNSMRCSAEVGRFVKELNSGKPLPDEVRDWWVSRY